MISAAAILAHDFGEIRQSWASRDAILYALGAGLGHDPIDPADLPYLYEAHGAVLPTFAVTLASPGMWIRDLKFGVDFARLVHLEQDTRFGAALPSSGEVVGTARVASLTDRGPDRGAELAIERFVRDAASGVLYCTIRQTLLLRGDGGFGGSPAERRRPMSPDRPADLTARLTLSPRAALIYRLSGDLNPLHVDPEFARTAGFERPIMHGLGVYGAVGVALCSALQIAPVSMRRLACRFAGTVMPGNTLELDVWSEPFGCTFAASVGGRRVLEDGRLEAA